MDHRQHDNSDGHTSNGHLRVTRIQFWNSIYHAICYILLVCTTPSMFEKMKNNVYKPFRPESVRRCED